MTKLLREHQKATLRTLRQARDILWNQLVEAEVYANEIRETPEYEQALFLMEKTTIAHAVVCDALRHVRTETGLGFKN